MLNQHAASVTQSQPAVARHHTDVQLQHIDLDDMRHFVDDEPSVLMDLLKLALTTSRTYIASVNKLCGEDDAPAQRLAIHNLLNIFNFLQAKEAVATARRAERHVAVSCAPLGPILLAELNNAWRAVETDLQKIVLAKQPGLGIN